MAITFTAGDNQFGTATGSNVNTTGGTSTFDDPPIQSTNLLITPNAGDPSPRTVELGDQYDVSFDLGGTTFTLEDATVLRTDSLGGNQGVVVLEGNDQNGDLAQVVWTPNYDLQGWYDANSEDGTPGFYTSDTDPGSGVTYMCFDAATRLRVPGGWRAAGDLAPGMQVETPDDGPRPVRRSTARRVRGAGPNTPIEFAPGAIGNDRPLRLSGQHRVLLRSPMAELMFGNSEVLVPAKALVDGKTVRPRPCARVGYVHLLMDRHQIVLAEGAPCETLLMGDVAREILDPVPPAAQASPMRAARPILTYREARAVLNLAPARPLGASVRL